ncbi:MAG: type I methionyl aminopeptidase [Candidatus Gracilibacteria bacterium]|nr:type I methionyl aminopeptidase [Candidatus Gracilibacteria bacterium]
MLTKPKNQIELNQIRKNGEIHKKIIEEVKKIAIEGTNGKQINDLVLNLCKHYNVEPAFTGIMGFKGAICININHCVAHGEPSKYKFQSGDVVTFDFGIRDKELGLNTDAAFTMIIGTPAHPEVERFLRINQGALMAGIKKAVPGNRVGDIGEAIEKFLENSGFHIIKDLKGHGIGYKVHEKPNILNYKTTDKGQRLLENMTICIEPLLGFNSGKISQDENGIYVDDGSLGSQFEHMIVIKKPYPEIIV